MSDVVGGLAHFLRERTGGPMEVTDLVSASAGARRRNVLFTASGAGIDGPRRLVATIIPTADLQILDIEVEAANLRFAASVGVPVPEVVGVSDDESYVGGPFFVSTAVEGETVPRRVLRLVDAHDGLASHLGFQCGAALARLHLGDPAGAHRDLGRPAPGRGPVAEALASARQQLDDLLQPSAPFELAYRWLCDTSPDDDRSCVVHGDFRNGNLIVGPDGLRAVLDWEACHIGSPMADPAWMCVRMWRFGNDRLPVGGFATVDDLRAGYEDAGGRWDADAFGWWTVFGSLRWGLGLANQARQHLDGEFRSIVMAASGRRIAELEYDVLRLLDGAFRGTSPATPA